MDRNQLRSMALIAVGAVVHVTAHTSMIRIGLRLRVTSRAGENRVIRRVGMAIAAHFGASVTCRPPGMVECRSCPRRRGMAGCAGCRESCGLMARIRRAFVFGRVTGIAIGRGSRIGIVDVAQVALHSSVRTGQGKPCRAVIECCPSPGSRIVTGRTQLRESCLCMIRIRRGAVIGKMTGNAIFRKACIDMVLVTRCTGLADVGARERKRRIGVVEGCAQKACCGVAKRTVLRETRLGVIRVCGAIVFSEMAGDAGCRQAHEDIVLVARRALYGGVEAG